MTGAVRKTRMHSIKLKTLMHSIKLGCKFGNSKLVVGWGCTQSANPSEKSALELITT